VKQHAEVLIGRAWRQAIPGWRDAVAVLLVVAVIIPLGLGAHQMVAPFVLARQPSISLSPSVLPGFALRTTMRMLAALVLSLIFTLTYATAAAKSRRAAVRR
jgi:NitT/TauT family transport system permease protein